MHLPPGESILHDDLLLPGVWFSSSAALSEEKDWTVPLALLGAMCSGQPLALPHPVSRRLYSGLDTTQAILSSWIPHARPVSVTASTIARRPLSAGASVFFSCGVDSFYSLIRHADSIQNLIIVHGFDVPLEQGPSFQHILDRTSEVAARFGKRLIVVRTNLRDHFRPCSWIMYHGASLASVALALAPNHAAAFIASSFQYKDLFPWGSHPLLDHLWSSEQVSLRHDGSETGRTAKLRAIAAYPEILSSLRVCWENAAAFNCGACEKCLRTMISLQAFGVLKHARFGADSVDPAAVRRVRLAATTLPFWREILLHDLSAEMRAAVEHAIRNQQWGLPPHGGLKSELKRLRAAATHLLAFSRAFLS